MTHIKTNRKKNKKLTGVKWVVVHDWFGPKGGRVEGEGWDLKEEEREGEGEEEDEDKVAGAMVFCSFSFFQ